MKLIKALVLVWLFSSCANKYTEEQQVDFPEKWHFKPGNNQQYAAVTYVDSTWKLISTMDYWENQGYTDLDGFAWYRTEIMIPAVLKTHKESGYLKIVLGLIDDCERVYMNGHPLAQNNKLEKNFAAAAALEMSKPIPDSARVYYIKMNDPRILWGRKNVFAVQVYDLGGNGGFHNKLPTYIAAVGLTDSLIFNTASFYIPPDSGGIDTVLSIKNRSHSLIDGKLSVFLHDEEKRTALYSTSVDITIKPGQVLNAPITLPIAFDPLIISFTVTDKQNKYIVRKYSRLNYIIK